MVLSAAPWVAEFWQLWSFAGDVSDSVAIAESIDDNDGDAWDWRAGSMRTRAQAIEEAMKLDAERMVGV